MTQQNVTERGDPPQVMPREPSPPIRVGCPLQVVGPTGKRVLLEVNEDEKGAPVLTLAGLLEVRQDEYGNPVLRLFNKDGGVAVELASGPFDTNGNIEVRNFAGHTCVEAAAIDKGGQVVARSVPFDREHTAAGLYAETGVAEVSLALHGSSFNALRVEG